MGIFKRKKPPPPPTMRNFHLYRIVNGRLVGPPENEEDPLDDDPNFENTLDFSGDRWPSSQNSQEARDIMKRLYGRPKRVKFHDFREITLKETKRGWEDRMKTGSVLALGSLSLLSFTAFIVYKYLETLWEYGYKFSDVSLVDKISTYSFVGLPLLFLCAGILMRYNAHNELEKTERILDRLYS